MWLESLSMNVRLTSSACEPFQPVELGKVKRWSRAGASAKPPAALHLLGLGPSSPSL